uniref:Heme oxygenase n=1 Tax=Trieres chinensis TaxID=1514140 RepID=A0A7S2EEF7_TRICV
MAGFFWAHPPAAGTKRRAFVRPNGACTALGGHPGGHPGGGHPGSAVEMPPATGFIDTELRGAAMRLHTRKQAPKEGEAAPTEAEKAPEPYVPTREDYLAFLVDSLCVYREFEDIVQQLPAMEPFRDTGLERSQALENDIEFMCKEYGLERPEFGAPGREYAEEIRQIAMAGTIPELMCHYYNFYFAHTAGGRMIGKQMSALLLDKKTLDFYKWEGDLNETKGKVKGDIEDMAAAWTREEKDQCVDATAGAFKGGGALNSYLSGGLSPH